jgi:hypothetical protein
MLASYPLLVVLELNEVNFEAVEHYCKAGKLPTFAKLITKCGYTTTTSETKYEEIEPWIQWVTAHTGLTLAEHGVFRLGDITKTDLEQIWEKLERRGMLVGAVSPMNAKNRLKQPAFFIPDPWTKTDASAPFLATRLAKAVSQIVGDNAQSRIQITSAFWLLVGLLRYARISNYGKFIGLIFRAGKKKWNKALVLDLLLSDLFLSLLKSKMPQFATIFCNAAAHIQHHYLYSSSAYEGHGQNPEWYIAKGHDPLLDTYEIYDDILKGYFSRFPNTRFMIATGLHQDPHGAVTFYWRLRNHAEFLRKADIEFFSVKPLMSRDFVIEFETDSQARIAAEKLMRAQIKGFPVFEVDNRGKDLFCMLTYPNEIFPETAVSFGSQSLDNFHEDVTFVAIKNGAHNSIGYFLDTHHEFPQNADPFALAELPCRVESAIEEQRIAA